MRMPGKVTVCLLMIATIMMASVSPVAAQEASPLASPGASPISGGGAGWRTVEEREITVDGQPVLLSPDGRWLAGPGPEDSFCVWEVATLNAACDGEGLAIRPETIAWAPDSSAVAFSLNAVQLLTDSALYVFEVAAWELRNLTDDGIDDLNLFGDDTEEPILIDDVPAWSPDGASLVFARTRWDPAGRQGTVLARIDRVGGETETLFAVELNLPFAVYSRMKWLEGDRLLYSLLLPDVEDERNGLWTADLDASDARQILPGDSTAEVPAPWLTDVFPDGRTASIYLRVKQTESVGESEIHYLLDVESGELTAITTGEEPLVRVTTPPRFSPDGASLVYAVIQGNDYVLVVHDLESGETGALVNDVNLGGADSTPVVLSHGLDWAENDTVLIPSGSASVLVTLEPDPTS